MEVVDGGVALTSASKSRLHSRKDMVKPTGRLLTDGWVEVKEEEDEAFHMAFEEMSRGSVKEAKAAKKPEKGTGFKEIRTKHKDAYQPWTTELDNKLIELFCNGINIKEMALYFGRTKGAIASRLRKLEIEELYG